jgi:hypothetical protein
MTKKPFAVVDPTLPKVPVEIDGKEYFLVFDFNSIVVAESLTGLNLLNALDFSAIDATKLRALLYASLLKLQPDITLESAGALITLKTAAKITQAMTRAFTESHPEPDADPNAQPPE